MLKPKKNKKKEKRKEKKKKIISNQINLLSTFF